MREYTNLPNPKTQREAFDEYLRTNNKVIRETKFWILIENSYIPNQLVCFSKNPYAENICELVSVEFLELQEILKPYTDCYIYINEIKDRSIPNRLHIHIKLD